MKFMAIIKSDADAEAGKMTDEQFMADMGTFNEKLVAANVMVGGEGLQASSKGARLKFAYGDVSVTPGPFPNPDELVAGFWMLQCDSLQEAIGWMKQCPHPSSGPMEIEIRQVFTEEDFAAATTQEA